jgi:hypothetical protein
MLKKPKAIVPWLKDSNERGIIYLRKTAVFNLHPLMATSCTGHRSRGMGLDPKPQF